MSVFNKKTYKTQEVNRKLVGREWLADDPVETYRAEIYAALEKARDNYVVRLK